MIKSQDLEKYGIKGVKEILHNPSYQQFFEAEMDPKNEGFEKGILTNTGAVAVKTGVFTGRSPKDKYFVKDSITEDTLWWDGVINRPVKLEAWNDCKDLVKERLSSVGKLYVMDIFCGTNPNTRMKVRFIMEVAWQAHFVKNMFIRPSGDELEQYW